MRVRALLQVQKTPAWTPASAKENSTSPGKLQSAWRAELCGSACVCTVPVPACDARREQQDMDPCCQEQVHGHAQVQIYVSHKACYEDTFPNSLFKSLTGSILMFLFPQPEFYQG